MVQVELESATVQDTATQNATKKQKLVRLGISLGKIPLDEMGDVHSTSAHAINKGSDLILHFAEEAVHKIDESKLRYETAAAVFRGAKNITTDHVISAMLDDIPEETERQDHFYKFNDAHYINVTAEAPHGLHSIQTAVRNDYANQQMKTAPRMRTAGRDFGWEQFDNPKKYPESSYGLPYQVVEPNTPTISKDRINNFLLDYVPNFLPDGF